MDYGGWYRSVVFCQEEVFFFKQKTAYELLSGLVGSEMCISDWLMLVPVDGGPITTLTSGVDSSEVWAFFWSPAGDKLAWVSVNAEEQELEWVVSPSDGSNNKRLFSFQPSSEVFIMLSFFDQYGYSHTPWSPDGKWLVVAGTKGKVALRNNGRTPTGDRVYVLDVEGVEGPRDLGAGVLAVWSWS